MNRTLITILVLAAAAAGLYAWGAIGRQEARELRRWADVTCASAGAPFVHVDHLDPASGKPAPRLKRGVACARRIADLAAFERSTNSESVTVLTDALEEQAARSDADAASAARDARAARAATERMEKADANLTDDQVGPDWFDALDELGGLR